MSKRLMVSLGLALIVLCLNAPPATRSAAQTANPASEYCTNQGGTVETRYPFYGTNGTSPLQLAGSLDVCVFTSKEDRSQILIAADTLYTDQPTLAASAYLAKVPMAKNQPSGSPSSFYCTQLGGTDTFGGVTAAGGGWAKAEAKDVISMCIFPDLSTIDSWGLTYHSEGTLRGADLSNLMQYKPPKSQPIFP